MVMKEIYGKANSLLKGKHGPVVIQEDEVKNEKRDNAKE